MRSLNRRGRGGERAWQSSITMNPLSSCMSTCRAREWRGQHGRRAARASTRAAAARARARPRLHAEELDNVLAVKPRERRHLLASGAHHRDRRYLHGDVCSERAEGRSTRAGGARLRVRLVACGAARTCERLDVLCDAHGAVRAGAEQAEVGPVDAVLPVRRERVGGRRRRGGACCLLELHLLLTVLYSGNSYCMCITMSLGNRSVQACSEVGTLQEIGESNDARAHSVATERPPQLHVKPASCVVARIVFMVHHNMHAREHLPRPCSSVG